MGNFASVSPRLSPLCPGYEYFITLSLLPYHLVHPGNPSNINNVQ